MNDCFGIDFGTTNSVLARATASAVEVITLDDNLPGEWAGTGFEKVLPSVIGFVDGQPTFGWLAKQQTENKLEAVKRLFKDSDSVRIGTEEMNVEEAAAIFFRHIQSRAAMAGISTRLDQAVVTVPANSRGVARYRTKLTAGLAGIEVTALINEPTAAAMAHARAIGHNQRILVFDWGGGTLDVTILVSVDGVFIEEASKGIQRLGGIDVDARFLDTVCRTIPGSADWLQHELNGLKLDLELAKIKLSSVPSTHIRTPRGGVVEVTRGQFEEAVWPLIEKTREPVETCLRESPGRIDHLIMVGGSSKIPAIQRFVSDLVGAEVATDVDPMTAIAEGAAIAAGILSGVISDVDFFVGAEHALGTIVHNADSPRRGEFATLIPRNHKYPATATKGFSPVRDMQETVLIEVIEGDPAKPIEDEDNVVLKQWQVELDPRPLSDAGFEVTFEYDVDGILRVLVTDSLTGKTMMDGELAFGASEDRSALPGMRRRVDGLMNGNRDPRPPGSTTTPSRLSAESLATLGKARTKVLPQLGGDDLATLSALTSALEAATPAEEERLRAAVESELRNHAYLL